MVSKEARTIPSINVTNANAPDPILVVGAPSDTNLLSSPPPSPAPSGYSTISPCPSPTLSVYSIGQHRTTLTLRDNQPDDQSGLASSNTLSPQNGQTTAHRPRASSATFNSTITEAGTDGDSAKVQSCISLAGLSTASARKKKAGTHECEGLTTHQLELLQDKGIDSAPFVFKPYQLAHMLDPKNLDTLIGFGGVPGLLQGLGTSAERGLSAKSIPASDSLDGVASISPASPRGDIMRIELTEPGAFHGKLPSTEDHPAHSATFDDRRRVFGENRLPPRPSKTVFQLMWLAMKDKVLLLLSVAAIVSLVLALVQDFKKPRKPGEQHVDWGEGLAIFVAIMIVVLVGSLNDWQKERQFRKLNEKEEERGVKVIRDGQEKVINIKEVLVGDIALLEPGDIIPCDGVFLSGHGVKCDESGATGESDAIYKLPYDDVLGLMKTRCTTQTDCFIISGSKVLEGVGKCVVVAVGTKCFNGRIMMSLQSDTENTPLKWKFNKLAELTAKIGSVAGLLLFVALMIRFFVQLGTKGPARTPNEKGMEFIEIFIISVTVIVVAVPEGLPLAVTLALAFATKRMIYDNLLVRVMASCETMANVSVICTNETGTLTQNSMTVVAGSIGVHAKFVRQLDDNTRRSHAGEWGRARKHSQDFSTDQTRLNDVLPLQLQELLNENIAVNSTAFEDTDPETGQLLFLGSKTEAALLRFAKELGWRNYREIRNGARIIQFIPFSGERQATGVVVQVASGEHRLYIKGASEILSKKCQHHVVINKDGISDPTCAILTRPIDELAEENISRTIIFYANQSLRTIALCYRDLPQWPLAGGTMDNPNETSYEELARDLTLIGIIGIEDPLRDGVRESVAKCQRAGIAVKMCTGENVLTARSVANQCGIFTPGGIIMEGPVFRSLTHSDRMEIVPRLQVLARSSPEDKKLLVDSLKSIGEVVSVTGDGVNDAPALKSANVGFSMGIAGTEVAKEASDIILMDDNFSSIIKAVMWGRCVHDGVRKFLQFQTTATIATVVITLVTAIASPSAESALSAVQLLWINIIMKAFAVLALATDPATDKLLGPKLDKKTTPLFSTNMYKMVSMQCMYQIIVTLILHFYGHRIFGYEHTKHDDLVIKTTVFNAFVFTQIFNSVNCRRLDRQLNVFEDILKNLYFISIALFEIGAHVVIVFVGGSALQVTRIPGREWGISLGLGAASIPLGACVRLLPNEPFEKLLRALRLLNKGEVLPSTRSDPDERRCGLTYSPTPARSKSKPARPTNHQDGLPTQSILGLAPTLIAGAFATGVRYNNPGSLADPAHASPSSSSTALWTGKAQFHPDTPKDDPAFIRIAGGRGVSD